MQELQWFHPLHLYVPGGACDSDDSIIKNFSQWQQITAAPKRKGDTWLV